MGKTRFNEPIIAPGFELFSGGTVGASPWAFDVTSSVYGAVGDGVADDTAAINAAVQDAFDHAVDSETCYAEVVFPAGIYKLSSATTKGGATKGNAQIPIPLRAGTLRKITLVFRGVTDAAAMPYWAQSGVGMRWGVTLKTTLTGQTSDAAWGAPSVIGGPSVSGTSAEYGLSHTSNFNNVCVVMQGIGISTPINPTIGGMDFRGMAQCVVNRCSVMADGSPTQLLATPPTHDWSFGVFGPETTNNDRCVFEDVSIYGQYYALVVPEHSWTNRSASIYCNTGLLIPCPIENIHSAAFGSISIEACEDGIVCLAPDSYGAPIFVAAVSMETINGDHIKDVNNGLCGTVHLTKLDGPAGISVDGAAHLEIIATNRDRGVATAPAIPATTVALQNPFWRHAAVTVTGGTVTAISIDGTATGITSGTVIVPSGHSITLAYSDNTGLAWKWVLL